MKPYLDTSALTKLYLREQESEAVIQWLEALEFGIMLTSLQRLELLNTFSLKSFRGEISSRQRKMMVQSLDEDLAGGRFIHMPFGWGDVFDEACGLAEKLTPRLGSRSLDILHVACARILKATHFLTFDGRQKAMAKAAKLKLIEL